MKERDYLEDLGMNGRIILKYNLKMYDVRMWAAVMHRVQ
jgi:hypothetical protein